MSSASRTRPATVAIALCSVLGACATPSVNAGVDGGSDSARADVGFSQDASASDAPVAANDAGTSIRYRTPTCDNGIPLPVGEAHAGPHLYGATQCVAAGAHAITGTDSWPDVTNARRPLVFVAPSGTGDGSSQTTPIGTIEAGLVALTAQGNGTLVLSAATHMLSGSISASSDVALLGVGGQTRIDSTSAVPAFQVATVSLSIEGIEIDASPTTPGATLRATDGATLTLRNVIIDHPDTAILTAGAHLDARELTIAFARGRAIDLGASGDAILRASIIGGGTHGIFTSGASLTASLVGIFGADTGVAALSTQPVTITLDRVASVGSQHLGVGLSGVGVAATIDHSLIAGTKFGHDGDGIGLMVRDGASVGVDLGITADDHQGRGTYIIDNRATGVLLSSGAHGELHGLLVGSNDQGGVVVQSTAEVGNLGFSFLQDNLGAGLVISTGASIAGLLCDGFYTARPGELRFGAMSIRMQDGAVIMPQTNHFAMRVENGSFVGNAGFGLLCDDVDATITAAKFMDNGIGWALYNGMAESASLDLSNNTDAAPMMNPQSPPGAVTAPQLR